MSAIKALAKVQQELHAPKSQFNKFGGYSYRSCEDILQAVKPLLGDAVILVSDEIKVVGDRIYVQATAKFCHGDQIIESVAYAREPLNKKGMDESQITAATSSYARKYALNGLLLIDDNKDADSMDNRQEKTAKTAKTKKPVNGPSFESSAATLIQIMIENPFEAAQYWRTFNHETQQPHIYKLLDKPAQNALKQMLRDYPAQGVPHNE